MLESTLQSKFIARVKSNNLGIAVKVDCPSRRGWPDVIYVNWKGEITLIEFKAEGKLLMPHQQEVHGELMELGCDVTVLKGEGRVNRFLDSLIRQFGSGHDFKRSG